MATEVSREIPGVEEEDLAAVAGLAPALPNVRAEPADRFAQAVRTLVEKRAQRGWPNETTDDVAVFVLVDYPRKVGEAHMGKPFADPMEQGTPLLGYMFFSSADARRGYFIPMPAEPGAILVWLEDHGLAGCPMVLVYRNAKKMVTRRSGIEDSARSDEIRDTEPTTTPQELVKALEHYHRNRVVTPTNCPRGVWKPGCAHQYIPGKRPEKSLQAQLEVALSFWFQGLVRAEARTLRTSVGSTFGCSRRNRADGSLIGSFWN